MDYFLFDDMIGNVTVINLLKRTIANNTLPNLCAFVGVLGTGKTRSASIAALSITCEDPKDGQACLKCNSCRDGMKALESTGESRYIKVVNAGKLNTNKDISGLLEEIFTLAPANHNTVYIIEEFHAIAEMKTSYNGQDPQTAFLAEVDRMPPNMYVFLTTTKEYAVLDTLISRSLKFTFGRLNLKESSFLFDKVLNKRGVGLGSPEVKKLVLESTQGIPRNILNSLDFVTKNNVTEEEYKDFIGIVDDNTFLDLFFSMLDMSITTMINSMEQMLESKKNMIFIDHLKGFILKCIVFKEAGFNEDLKVDSEMLNQVIEKLDLFKVMTILEKLSYRSTDNDIRMCFMQIRNLIQNRTMTNVLRESKQVGKALANQSARTNKSMEQFNSKSVTGNIASKPIGIDDLSKMKGFDVT